MLFGISPESCSASPRNAVRLAPEYAIRAWAAGVLFIRPEALDKPSVLKTAREHHAALRQLLGEEYHKTLDSAIDTLEQGMPKMAAAA